LRGQQLADAIEPRLAARELQVLFAAALGHGLMGHGIGQRQGLIEPARVEAERVVTGLEGMLAVKAVGVMGVIIRGGVSEACPDEGQRAAQ
jgi:hypothetical protein